MYKNVGDENTSSYRQGMRGKCHICTGCGRCNDTDKTTDIIAKMPLFPTGLDSNSAAGIRLVTVDIGTTTIAMQLHNSDGSVEKSFATVNPQVRCGADVISRIQAVESSENIPDETTGAVVKVAEWMKQSVRDVIEQGLMQFQECLSKEETMRMVIAANTTMSYLLMGWDAAELGAAPFCATHLQQEVVEIAGVSGILLPGFSAFIGGDIAAGIVACGMDRQESVTLLIDLGTNGEMVLGNKNRMIACATAAGPAFEGGVNRGIWGADMVSLLAMLRRMKLIDETGLLADAYFDEGIKIAGVTVTQQSIRAIQLAKAAITAGIRILVKNYGINVETIDRVVLAGGFGYYLKPEDAAEIGLLPKELVGKTVTGGNTALTGALIWGAGEVAADILKLSVEVLNLAEEPDFEQIYLESMELKEQTEK